MDDQEYEAYFNEQFGLKALADCFFSTYEYSTSKGIDRLDGPAFRERARPNLHNAAWKIRAGFFRFTPYLQELKLKAWKSYPRVIAIPTIRDRVVLAALKNCLHHAFADCVPGKIANTLVHDLIGELRTAKPLSTFICRCDVKDFYGSIDRNRLLRIIRRRLSHEPTVNLVKEAVETPTVPQWTPSGRYDEYKTDRGVQQGLAVSNILAAIYMQDVDAAMCTMNVGYRRYVDDVLIYGRAAKVQEAFRSLRGRLRYRGLAIHPLGSGKTEIVKLSQPFEYLGYRFEWPLITVRRSTIERLLQGLVGQFTDYLRNKDRKLKRYSYLHDEDLKNIFLLELNERITGAVSDKKRYGWIAYYNQIGDLTLLHKLDHAVARMFARMPDFDRQAPAGLKRFARSYFEMKYNPYGGYVRNYDKFETAAEKAVFLAERGRIGPEERLTGDEIEARFEMYKRQSLAKMHADEANIY